jgi:hypothetical protein
MTNAEASVQPDLKKENDGQAVDTGVWVETFEPELPPGSPYGPTDSALSPGSWDINPRAGVAPAANKALTNSISRIKLTCRLVDRTKISLSANSDLAFAVRSGLNASQNFTNAVLGDKGIQRDPSDPTTYTFELTVGLKHPLKL